ncbi:9-divinyl ether synthase-like [Arachis hypogaea]|nr:9-divinyl ether synthase-like [Arachis hypogaea]
MEESLAGKSKEASYNTSIGAVAFTFIFRLLTDKDPNTTVIGSEGPKLVETWLGAQLAPLATLGYNKLYEGVSTAGTAVLDEAEKLGIKRDEACHNLVFMLGFNAFGGLSNQFPILIKWIGLAGEGYTSNSLMKSGPIEPAVPYQYAKAREDLVVQSHDAAYEIKKGEMIFGYQPFATKDPKIFENPEEFVGHRFIGDGERLLRNVFWSNGREVDEPTADNKQCPAKNLVVLLCRVYLVEFFLRYDTFAFDWKPLVLGPTVTIKSLTKCSNFKYLLSL